MVIFDDNIRDIIGSFYPSRPILTNAEIYRKILDMNPEFSLYRLYLRYSKWYANIEKPTSLYEKLKDYNFYAYCESYKEPIVIYVRLGHGSNGIIELLTTETEQKGLEYFDTVDDEMQIIVSYGYELYEELYRALLTYVRNDISKPLFIKPYIRTEYMYYYSHIEEPPGDTELEDEEVDAYVNKIQYMDSSFSLSRLYYIIHDQYMRSKKLTDNVKDILITYLDEITYITYDFYDIEQTVSLWNDEEHLYTIEVKNKDVFIDIVSNLYHGVNTSEIQFNIDGKIEINTHDDNDVFKINDQ